MHGKCIYFQKSSSYVYHLFKLTFVCFEWSEKVMAQNIKSICYLFGMNYNLLSQGNKWLYSFHYIFPTFEKWELDIKYSFFLIKYYNQRLK